MRVDITAQQYTSFQNNHEISFANFLSAGELAILKATNQNRNNFQGNPLVKKVLLRRDLGLIIHELTKAPQIRLLEDQFVEHKTINVSDLAFQGVLIGALFHLETGEVTFFHPDKELIIEKKTFLVVYGQGNSLYIKNEKDPFVHELKKCGYCFGDRLKPVDFPFIYH